MSERLEALEEPARGSSDDDLKTQIKQRAEYEAAVLKALKDNPNGRFVYVVEDNNSEPYGFFAGFDAAAEYAAEAAREFEEYDCRFHIEKHPVVSKANPGEKLGAAYFERAYVLINEAGEISDVYSSEIPCEKLAAKNRFEKMYFKIPFGMDHGIVKNVADNTYGVLAENEENWMRFLGKWSDDELEFGDIQVMVYELTDNGLWSHEHINPLYLEPETPESIVGDEKQAAFIAAANALVEYFKNETEQNGRAVIDTAKAYAEACHRLDCKYLLQAAAAGDIFC